MKKYVIFTLVLLAALLIFGLVAVNVPSAQAITTTLPDTGVVGDNFCSDPFFETAPLVGNINSSNIFDSWYFYGSSGSYTYTLSDGLHYSCSEAWRGISYLFSSVPLNVPFTVSFYLKNSGTIYCGLRGHSGSSTVVITEQSIATSSSYRVVTLTFTLTALSYDRYFLFFWLQTASTFDLSSVKFELGSSFTGFVSKDYENYGYDQGFDEGFDSGVQSQFDYQNGWTIYSVFRDYLHTNERISNISSSNGGTVDFVSSQGAVFTSPADGTSFSLSTGASSLSTSNTSYTLSLGYIGSFTEGDVFITVQYNYWASSSSQYPWHGTDDTSTSFTYNLVPGKTFVYYISRINNIPSVTFTLRSGVNFALQAYKVEQGNHFTRFPVDGAVSQSSFDNGFASGQVDGYNNGYSVGYDSGYTEGLDLGSEQGYDRGFDVGRNQGYNEGLSTAQNGNWVTLMAALIDIPVSASMSLLNFDFFGVNMWNFARFVLTFTLFVSVLHIFTKGKLRV